MQQYAVDFGGTALTIQMEATKSVTLSAQGGGLELKQDCTVCQERKVV